MGLLFLLLSKLSKVSRYRINTKKSFLFLFPSNEQSKEVKDLYAEN